MHPLEVIGLLNIKKLESRDEYHFSAFSFLHYISPYLYRLH